MNIKQRHERIINKLAQYERLGIVSTITVRGGERVGVKWVFTPAGHAERSLTTSQIEDFILGVEATLSSHAIGKAATIAVAAHLTRGAPSPTLAEAVSAVDEWERLRRERTNS